MKGKTHIRHGFTLVELLVVIGIIAVLISMLLPALTKARKHANLLACLATMRQIGIGMQAYANDNRGFVPGYLGPIKNAAGAEVMQYTYPTMVAMGQRDISTGPFVPCGIGCFYPYLRSPKVFFDPSAEATATLIGAGMVYSDAVGRDWRQAFVAGNATKVLRTGYLYRSGMFGRDPGITNAGPFSLKVAVNAKHQRAMLMDFYYTASDGWPGPSMPHGDSINMIYYDGHGVTIRDQKRTIWNTPIGSSPGKYHLAEARGR